MRKRDKTNNIKEVNQIIETRRLDNILIKEALNDTYFETLSSALDYVKTNVEKKGFTLDENSLMVHFGTGGVSYGETKGANIEVLKDGKSITNKLGKQNSKYVHISLYRMPSGRYELTFYFT